MNATDSVVEPLATPDDLRGVISTDLTDEELAGWLDDAAAEIAETVPAEDLTESRRRRLEKFLAALRVREIRDRDAEKASRESVSLTYETASVDGLRRQVRSLDPTGELAPGQEDDGPPGVIRRTARVGKARLYAAANGHHRDTPEGTERPR